MFRPVWLISICAVAFGPMVACHRPHQLAGADKNIQPAIVTAAINRHCPILGWKETSAAAPTITYEGHVIGFCCQSCPAKWDKWPEARKNAFVARQMGN